MTWEQVAAVALEVGWTQPQAVIATAITGNESARYPAIVQQGQPYSLTGWGLWQITPGDSAPAFGINEQLLNPMNNGRAAKWKFDQAGGWSPWAADFPTIIQQYIPAATDGVAAAAKLTPQQRQRLIREVSPEVGVGLSGSTQVSDWSPQIVDGGKHVRRTALHLAGLAQAVASLRARPVPPVVTVPAARGIVWIPGQPWPAPDVEAP